MNEDFQTWYRRADRHVILIAGVGIDDLTDGCSHDAWSAGVSPEEYAEERLEDDGFPF